MSQPDGPQTRVTVATPHVLCLRLMTNEGRPPLIRIVVTLAAYQAIVPALPKDRLARPGEPLKDGEGVSLWIDYRALRALKRKRRAGEGWSEVILRLYALKGNVH